MFALIPNAAQTQLTANEVFEKCRERALQIDDNLKSVDIKFTQEIEFRSRSGDKDDLVFNIVVRHGKFEREVVSSTVKNGDRFNGGYDAFDKMFLLSAYFDEGGKSLSSCEFQDCGNCYKINFTLSRSSPEGIHSEDMTDALNVGSASLTTNDFTPMSINEEITGLPLGVEFDDGVKVAYDKTLDMCYPENIVMRVYAHLFFLKGEIAVVTIRNKNLARI